MAKLADRSQILIETANNLLIRLYNSKALLAFEKTRPSIFDQQYTKLVSGITKKFPEPPGSEIEKIQGYDGLSAKSKQHMEELEPHYLTFVDLLEFKELALSVLNDISNSWQDFKMEENPNVTSAFLDLATLYVRVQLLLCSIDQRKVVISTYHRAFFVSKCSNEPNYTKVATFVAKVGDNPLKEIENEFRNIAPKLGKALNGLLMTYMKARDVQAMRKEGVHNITLKPEKLALPVKDPFHQQVEYAPKMYVWIMYGFYFCQDELNKSVDLLKFAMAEGFLLPVFRDVTYSINSDYESLISNSKIKTLKKKKKEIIESSAVGVSGSGPKHRQRRIYLRQELGALYHLFCDKPGLLGPKFQVVLSALSLAKDEIFWFYRHTNQKLQKKANPEDFRDNRMSELFFLVLQITELIHKNKQLIQTYYLEYLKGADYQSARQAVSTEYAAAVGSNIASATEAILNELASINTSNVDYSFKTFRVNWCRVESLISTTQAVNMPKVRDVLSKFSFIIPHTKNVDSIDTILDDYASLKGLYYFRDAVMQTFDKSITDVPVQPLHSMAFLKLAASFVDNVSQFLPEEREVIGNESVNMATQMLEKITSTIVANVNEVVRQYTSFDNQLLDLNAAYPLLMKQKDYKPDKNFVPPATPGSESVHKNRPQLEALRLTERNIFQLCTAMNEFISITVYDTFFTPREFLKEALSKSFIQHVKKSAVIDGETIQRPTVTVKLIEVFTSVLSLVENFVDIDVGALLREAFIGQTYARGLEFNGKYDWVWDADEPPDPNPDNVPLVKHIAQWYGNFVPKKLATPGICYSTVRRGFVSESTVPFKAENYVDIVELKALATLVGPYGFKLIHRELYKVIAANLGPIKEILSANRPVLDELSKNYFREAACNETLRKLKEVDTFIQRSVVIGNALLLRDLLSEALSVELEDKVPFIYNTINTCFHQYDRNIFMVPELLPVDSLAAEAGVEVGTADQAFKTCVLKVFGKEDSAAWNILPFMYAAAFTGLTWKDAEYKPIIEAHSNNLHALVKTIISIIVGSKSLQLTAQGEKEIILLLQKFVEVSSVILLRMSRIDPKSEKKPPKDFPSIIIFMDLFMQECPVLTRDVLETSLPNGLLRSMYKEIYKPKPLKKKELSDTQNTQEI